MLNVNDLILLNGFWLTVEASNEKKSAESEQVEKSWTLRVIVESSPFLLFFRDSPREKKKDPRSVGGEQESS